MEIIASVTENSRYKIVHWDKTSASAVTYLPGDSSGSGDGGKNK